VRRPTRLRTCRFAWGWPTPPSPYSGNRNAPQWCKPAGDRPGVAASQSGDNSHLRQSGSVRTPRSGPAVAGRRRMTDLRQALNDYLAMRRALGFKLQRAGQLLPGFVTYMEQAGAATITTELALA